MRIDLSFPILSRIGQILLHIVFLPVPLFCSLAGLALLISLILAAIEVDPGSSSTVLSTLLVGFTIGPLFLFVGTAGGIEIVNNIRSLLSQRRVVESLQINAQTYRLFWSERKKSKVLYHNTCKRVESITKVMSNTYTKTVNAGGFGRVRVERHDVRIYHGAHDIYPTIFPSSCTLSQEDTCVIAGRINSFLAKS